MFSFPKKRTAQRVRDTFPAVGGQTEYLLTRPANSRKPVYVWSRDATITAQVFRCRRAYTTDRCYPVSTSHPLLFDNNTATYYEYGSNRYAWVTQAVVDLGAYYRIAALSGSGVGSAQPRFGASADNVNYIYTGGLGLYEMPPYAIRYIALQTYRSSFAYLTFQFQELNLYLEADDQPLIASILLQTALSSGYVC